MPKVQLLDYVAGNVRSLVNAIEKVGYEVEWIRSPDEVPNAEKLILPGVGHFGHCLGQLGSAGYLPAIRAHIDAGKPFMGVCVGLQAIFAGSAEDPAVPGLGLISSSSSSSTSSAADQGSFDGLLDRFDDADKAVPHIGWNDAVVTTSATTGPSEVTTTTAQTDVPATALYGLRPGSKYYYVHSYKYPYRAGELEAQGWSVATGTYGGETFVGAVARGNVLATQFHPEKSGVAGLRVLRAFLDGTGAATLGQPLPADEEPADAASATRGRAQSGLTRRVIACLDVRANDAGDLVVTKGDQYDVREKTDGNEVRNLGKPVDMARRYYEQGADEVTFLNITSFRDLPLGDRPMLEVLRQASRTVFVPLTIGGGIRDTPDPAQDGRVVPALEIAAMYFASGADKVSVGSDAVTAAEEYMARGCVLDGTTAIEQISGAYGRQAVVVSVDPKRVYVSSPSETQHACVEIPAGERGGPAGERFAWYACTIKGGRETRDVDVVQLVTAVEAMGCGEILLNCIDRDGSNAGFDLALVRHAKAAVRIPVIASSGAGIPAHFDDVFRHTTTDAALGAGMFHRGEYTVQQVKDHLAENGLVVRQFEGDL